MNELKTVDLKSQKIMIVDRGLFPELAQKLGESYGQVLYYSHLISQFSKSRQAIIGQGLKNVTVVDNIWDYVDDISTFCFPDVGDSDIQRELKAQGKFVFGADHGEELELDKWGYRELAKKLGMNMPKTVLVKGVKALRAELKGTKHRYIKIHGDCRGDAESWCHENDATSEPYLRYLEYNLGIIADTMEFIVDEAVGDIETGIDTYYINGNFPDIAVYGYEIKDKSYCAKVSRYSNIPKVITDTNEKLSIAMKKCDYNSAFSSEVRVDKQRRGYLLDPTCRFGNPPGDAMIEVFSNWAEIIYWGARGKLINPKPVARYFAMAMIQSEYSDKDWQTITFPEADRRFYKFKNVAKMDGKYWIIPLSEGLQEIGSVIGLGNSIEEAIGNVKKRAENIHGYDIDVSCRSLDEAKDTIAEGLNYGIQF